MSWIDVAGGAGGAATAVAVGAPIILKFVRPWFRELLVNASKAAAGAETAAANSQQLQRNGGSSVADKANVAAESSLRTEAKLDQFIERFHDHEIESAKKGAIIEYQIEELRRMRN